MSSQRGNYSKKGQKHQNTTVYKNNLYDTSKRTKMINSLDMQGLCERCKSIIEWKVKYKKYKPLTQPKKCVKCNEKKVTRAYFTICSSCIVSTKLCGKCAQPETIVEEIVTQTQSDVNQEFEAKLKCLRERERRTLLRIANSTKSTDEDDATSQAERSKILKEEYLKSKLKDMNFDSDDGEEEEESCSELSEEDS